MRNIVFICVLALQAGCTSPPEYHSSDAMTPEEHAAYSKSYSEYYQAWARGEHPAVGCTLGTRSSVDAAADRGALRGMLDGKKEYYKIEQQRVKELEAAESKK
jgi:hypothetical protein